MRNRIVFLSMILAIAALWGAAMPAQAEEGPNLLPNPSFETPDATGTNPQQWNRGRWGSNIAVFQYPATPAFAGTKAARVEITAYATGDAKWYHQEIPITPGGLYRLSGYYLANVPSVITLQYRLSNGSLRWEDIATPAPASSYTQAEVVFTAPGDAQAVTVFHLIKQVGVLTVDNFELRQILPSPAVNLIPNGSLNSAQSNDAATPQQWRRGRWGIHQAVFRYPVGGFEGCCAAQVALISYTSGDAKWVHDEVPVTPGESYAFSNRYASDTTSFVTLQYRLNNGQFQYIDLAVLPPAAAPQSFNRSFTVPPNVVRVTVFHLIKSLGTLTTDDYRLIRNTAGPPPDPSQFPEGMISLNFDDGLKEVFNNAIPILNAAGLKSTQYIVSGRFNFPAYVTQEQVLQMQSQGHEIGAHTRTHADLTALPPEEARAEIAGSRQDLLGIGVQSVTTFAYPLGALNDGVVQMVKDAGFAGARTTFNGTVSRTDDRYTLKRMNMDGNVTFAQAKSAIDAAVSSRQWLILLFHHVNNSGGQFTVTPQFLQQIADYLVQQNVRVVTTAEGIQQMAP